MTCRTSRLAVSQGSGVWCRMRRKAPSGAVVHVLCPIAQIVADFILDISFDMSGGVYGGGEFEP